MTSMDKRRGSYLGKPAQRKYVALVLAQPLEGGDIEVKAVYSNSPKAQARVDALMCEGGDSRYWSERWPIE